MALGKGKKSTSKKEKKDNSSKRYIASIWSNEGKDGRDDYLSLAVDNLDPKSEYNKGSLIWYDKETEKYYKIKSLSVYTADKGPANLTNKIVLDLENEYHVEEMES